MPTYLGKMQYRFNDYGWSETWYGTASSAAEMFSKIEAIITTRSVLCGWGVILQHVFCRDVTRPHTGRRFILRRVMGAVTLPCDNPNHCIQARVRSGTSVKRNVYLRGIPDGWALWSTAFAEFMPHDNAYPAFRAFRAALTNAGLMFRGPVYPTVAAPAFAITGWTTAGGRLVMNAPGRTWTSGRTVAVRGVKGMLITSPRDVNRNHYVHEGAAGTAQLDMLLADFPDYEYWVGGTAYQTATDYYPISGGEIHQISTYKVGESYKTWKGKRRKSTLPVIPISVRKQDGMA
jgi:hypothetical protein